MGSMTETVLSERRGQVGVVTLNRPRALNAINEAMIVGITDALQGYAQDGAITCVVLRSAHERAFCAGADIRAVRDRRGDDAFMDRIYRIEYELDYLIHAFPKPLVVLINGITMGGGCGLALHARYRIASPDLVLAMPETGIGFFPDVGGSVFLSRLPDGIGAFMGVTGARIGAGDALALEMVDAVAPRDAHDEIIAGLAAGEPADQVVGNLPPQLDPSSTLPSREAIAAHFQGESALAIVERLQAAGDQWAADAARLLRQRCPFSLEVTTRLIEKGRGLSLREALAADFRLAQRFMRREDYFEGVRAVLIDRDNRPSWRPGRLEEVDIDEVGACFAPLPGQELWPEEASTT
jgi:enoyl-CoA hydratase